MHWQLSSRYKASAYVVPVLLTALLAQLVCIAVSSPALAKGKTSARLKGPGYRVGAGSGSPIRRNPSGRQPNSDTGGLKGTGYTVGCIGPAPKNPNNWTPGCKPQDPKGPSAWELAQRASNLLTVPKPLIRTAPPRGKRELVGIPTWFWLDKSQWTDRSATARAGDVSATVTASAYEIVVEAGDGSDPFTCSAPWTPYVDGAKSACTHAYRHSGRYTVTVAAYWGADWTGSDGNGGTLPTVGRTVRFSVQVVQARSELVANP